MIKILLVEDHAEYRKTLKEILVFNKYEVVEAENGEEGYIKSVIENPDIIITDLDMPKVSGLEFIFRLRDIEERNSRTPVIVLSASIDEGVRKAMKSLKIAKFIEKPVNIKNLLQTVEDN